MQGHRAAALVAGAIKNGELPRITDETLCVDCGASARVYDHRDYTLPLVVEPVCDSCNRKRGPAAFNAEPISVVRVPGEIIDGRCTAHPDAELMGFCPRCRKTKPMSQWHGCEVHKKGGAPRKTEPKAKPS